MAQHHSLNRRTMLAGGGALFFGAAFGPAALHAQSNSDGKILNRHHRRRPYRRHDRRVVGQGRPSGAVLVAPSRRTQGVRGRARPLRTQERSTRRSRSAMSCWSPCHTARCRSSAATMAAALKGKIVLDACNAVAARDGAIAEEVERTVSASPRRNTCPARGWCARSTRCRTRYSRSEANRPDPKLAIPIAGDDAEAVQVAAGIGARRRL